MADVAHVAPAATPNGGAGDAAAVMPTKRKNKPSASYVDLTYSKSLL